MRLVICTVPVVCDGSGNADVSRIFSAPDSSDLVWAGPLMELMYRAEAGAVPTTPIIDVYVDSVKIWGETFAGSPSVYVVHPQKQAYDETGTVITDAYFPMVLNERITARVVVSSGGASSRFNIDLIFDIEAELEMFA